MSDVQKTRQAAPRDMQQALDDLRLIAWRLQPLGTHIGVPPETSGAPIAVNHNYGACLAPAISKAKILEIFNRVTDLLG